MPVLQVFVLCEDCNVLGTPFYIMEFLKGRIFADMSMSAYHQKSGTSGTLLRAISLMPNKLT